MKSAAISSSLSAMFHDNKIRIWGMREGRERLHYNDSLSRSLAKRLGSLGVRVNTIYPGFIVTEMTEGIHQMPELEEKEKSESPLHMLGEPEDVAACVLYLASDASRFVTGVDFAIDGGAIC